MILKEYIVTLKNRNDLDSFYLEMESESDTEYIPKRAVQVVRRRPNSKNTNYLLSDEEANLLRSDYRVEAVNISLSLSNITIGPLWNQSENSWNKTSALVRDHKNWGLFRCSFGQQINGWGSDDTPSQSGSINIPFEAANVDVVIVDGHANPGHPEFAKYGDGSGYSRMIQYNWFQHEPNVSGGSVSTYPYPTTASQYNNTNDNHGCHVAGIVAGNSNGWAREANIYNIKPYGSVVVSDQLFEYIREFHLSKPTNPATGFRNPTIVNNSWNYTQNIDITEIISINYRGNVVTGPFTIADTANLIQYGLVNSSNGIYNLGAMRSDIKTDIEDCIDAGIIFVGAAPRNGFKIDVYGGPDYDNYIQTASSNIYYHRGASPVTDVRNDGTKLTLTVGAIDSLSIESKANLSGTGPRVDIFAPGFNIMSSVNTPFGFSGVSDPRNAAFYLTKNSGTSLAAAQATGVLACYIGQYPSSNMSSIIDIVSSNLSSNGQIFLGTESLTDYSNPRSLLGAPNLYLKASFTVSSNGYARGSVGVIYPPLKYLARAGLIRYPRVKTKQTN